MPAHILALVITLALVASCTHLDRDAASQDRRHESIILDSADGESIPFPPHATRRLASAESTEAGLSLFEIVIPAASGGAPPHTHTYEDEFFYVRSGSSTFMAYGVRRTVGVGGFALLPRNSMHAIWNSGEEDAILLVGTSRGRFDDFFDAVALEARQSDAQSPGQIGQIMVRLGADRGIEIHMDQVPADVAELYGLPVEDTHPR
jgi:uncharacterized cupin superfamily protein